MENIDPRVPRTGKKGCHSTRAPPQDAGQKHQRDLGSILDGKIRSMIENSAVLSNTVLVYLRKMKPKGKKGGAKAKGKKKKAESSDEDSDEDRPVIFVAKSESEEEEVAPPPPVEEPKKKKKGKNLENAAAIGDLPSVETNAGYSPYAVASGQGSDSERCNPSDLSSQYGNGLSIDCDFGFKGWYICKITCAKGRPDTEVVSCDTGSKQWDTSNVKCN